LIHQSVVTPVLWNKTSAAGGIMLGTPADSANRSKIINLDLFGTKRSNDKIS